MSTRGFLGFVVDGAEKIAYNHFDSYPGGLGVEVLQWLRVVDLKVATEDARSVRIIPAELEDEKPGPEDVARYSKWLRRRNARPGQSLDEPDDWYDLLYGTRGKPDAILEAGALVDASRFPLDSLFAEWGYLVDFDAQVFEAYRGFQKAPHDKGRFADREVAAEDRAQGYWPCALVASWPLISLPADEDFVKLLEGDEDE